MATTRSSKAPSKRRVPRKTTKVAGIPSPYAGDAPTKRSATFAAFREGMFSNGGDAQEAFDRLLRKYGQSTTWVYIATTRIAQACSQIPLNVMRTLRTGPPRLVQQDQTGLAQLIEMPNPFQGYSDFIEAVFLSLELTGNAFIEKAKITRNRPTELYVLNPSRITIIPHPKNMVRGYIFENNAEKIFFPRDEIIHIKYTHPSNDFWGLSPLTAARLAIDTDQSALEWNRNFLKKGGWPSGAIMTEHEVDEDSEKRLKRNIGHMLQRGKDQAGLVLLLTGGLKYQGIAVSPKDADWLDARRMSRDEILSIFGVPFAVAGLYSTEQTTARSAGVMQQIRTFYHLTVLSKIKKYKEALNRELVPLFNPRYQLHCDFRSIPALADDLNRELLRAQIFRTLVNTGWSLNAALDELYPHMSHFPWGDVYWTNQAMVGISGSQNPALVLQPPGQPIEDPDDEKSIGLRLARTLGINGGSEDALARTCATVLKSGLIRQDELEAYLEPNDDDEDGAFDGD